MADTSITSNVNNGADFRRGLHGPYWADPLNGVIIFIDGSSDVTSAYTDDGGATWTLTVIEAGNCMKLDAWYDQEVNGLSTTIAHVAWLDADTGACKYTQVEASDGTQGRIRTVNNALTVSTTASLNRLAITLSLSENVVIAGSTQTEIFAYKSADFFATAATTIADVMETATEEDHMDLFPANTGDNNDVCGAFWDRSANEISVKMYDDSANTWTETSVSTGMSDSNRQNMAGAIRFADNHLILAAHNNDDHATDDLQVWDITVDSIASPTITAKTNVFDNIPEAAQAHVVINQQNDDIYIAYVKGGTINANTDIYYKLSTDGGTTWGSEVQYSERNDDVRQLGMSKSITDLGGRIQFSFYEDDLSEIWVNLVNDIEITAVGGADSLTLNDIEGGASVDSLALTQVHGLALNTKEGGGSVDSATLTQNHTLGFDAIEGGASIDDVALTQVHSLLGDDITGGASVDSASLIQVHSLLTDDIEGGSSVGNLSLFEPVSIPTDDVEGGASVGDISLSQNHTLAFDAIEGGAAVDDILLSGNLSLVLDGVTGGASVDNIAFNQQHALATDDIEGGATIDALLIGTGFSVLLDNVFRGSSVDSAILAQNHILATDDITGGSVVDQILLGGIVPDLVYSLSGAITGTNRQTGAISGSGSLSGVITGTGAQTGTITGTRETDSNITKSVDSLTATI